MTSSEPLKEIKLVVHEKFVVPDVLAECDPRKNEEVLSLGSSMYREKRRILVNMTNQSLTEQLKKEHDDHTEQLKKKHDDHLQALSENHSMVVTQLQAEKQALEISVKSLREKSSDLIEIGFANASSVHADKLKEKEKDLSAQIAELQQRLRTSEKQAIELRQAAIKDKESDFGRLMDMSKAQLKQKEEEHNKTVEILKQQIQDFKKAMEKSQEAESVALRDCSQSLQKLTGTSSVIGQVGELKLDAFIRKRFSNARVECTAHQEARADMLVTIETLKLTVECKNVVKLNMKEIEKFWRDIENMLSSKEANAALFISWKDTDLHNGNKHFAFDYRKGIPVIYISDAEGNPELITFSIRVLLSLVKNGMTLREHDEAVNDKSKYVLELVRDLHADYVVYENMLKKDRKVLSTMQAQLKEKEKILVSMSQKFSKAIEQYPDIVLESFAKTAGSSKSTKSSYPITNWLTTSSDHDQHSGEHQTADDASKGVKRKRAEFEQSKP